MTLTETVVAIASPPSDEKSLWNKRNRKARKRVIRRSIWTLVISTALYKTATHFRGQQQPSHDISHDDIPSEITIPASQMDGTNMNKGRKKEKDKRSKLEKQEEELRRKQREKDKFKSLDDFTATKAKPSPKKKKKTKTAKEEKIELTQNISVEIPIQKEPIQEEKVEVDRSSNTESASGDSVTDSSSDNISISISSSPEVPEIPEVSLIVEESTTNTKTVVEEEVEEKVTQYHLESRPKRCSIPILKGFSKNMCQEYDSDKSSVSFPRKKLHFDFSEDDLVDLLFITGIGKYQKTKPHEKMIEEENAPGIDSTTEADNKHIACLFPFADLLVPECRADSTKTGTQIDSNII